MAAAAAATDGALPYSDRLQVRARIAESRGPVKMLRNGLGVSLIFNCFTIPAPAEVEEAHRCADASDELHWEELVVGPPAQHPLILPDWAPAVRNHGNTLSAAEVVTVTGRAPLGLCVLLGMQLSPLQTLVFAPYVQPLSCLLEAVHADAETTDDALLTIELARPTGPLLNIHSRRVGNVLVYFTLNQENNDVRLADFPAETYWISHVLRITPYGRGKGLLTTDNQDELVERVMTGLVAARTWISCNMSRASAVYLSTSAPMFLATLMGVVFRPQVLDRTLHVLDRGLWEAKGEAGRAPTTAVLASLAH